MLRTKFDPQNKVFSGRESEPIFNPKALLGDLLIENIRKDEKAIRVVSKFVKILRNETHRGDVVSSIVQGLEPSDPNLMLFYVAAILHGNPIHFIDHRAGAVEIRNAIKVTDAKIVSVELESFDDVEDKELSSLLIEFQNADPVALFSTAGISGLPKLVPLSAATIIHHLSSRINSTAPVLSFQPLSKYRIFLDALAKLIKGVQMEICTEFCVTKFQEKCCNTFQGDLYLTNYQLAKIVSDLDGSVENVQQILCSGSYANPMLIRRAKAVFPNAKFVYSYGLTEFGGPVALNPDAGAKYTVGQLNDNFHVTIRDEQGQSLGVGREGEIFVKSPIPFQGYYQNDECTKSTLTADGWCRTGDIGYFDQDLDFHILDREKDVIVCDCNVISIAELELYLKKIPGVSAVKVYGVADKDLGEKPAANIVRSSDAVTEEGVHDFILTHLGQLKALKGGIQFVDKL